MDRVGVLNVRGVPRRLVEQLKAQASLNSLTIREATILLLEAVVDGRISLTALAKRGKV